MNEPRYPSERRLDGPHSLCGGQINLSFLTGTELPTFGPPARSILNMLTALPRLLIVLYLLFPVLVACPAFIQPGIKLKFAYKHNA
jgi:hypothetical protein